MGQELTLHFGTDSSFYLQTVSGNDSEVLPITVAGMGEILSGVEVRLAGARSRIQVSSKSEEFLFSIEGLANASVLIPRKQLEVLIRSLTEEARAL